MQVHAKKYAVELEARFAVGPTPKVETQHDAVNGTIAAQDKARPRFHGLSKLGCIDDSPTSCVILYAALPGPQKPPRHAHASSFQAHRRNINCASAKKQLLLHGSKSRPGGERLRIKGTTYHHAYVNQIRKLRTDNMSRVGFRHRSGNFRLFSHVRSRSRSKDIK